MEKCCSDFVFWYREESSGIINKIVKPGELLALEQNRKVYVEFEATVEDAGGCSS